MRRGFIGGNCGSIDAGTPESMTVCFHLLLRAFAANLPDLERSQSNPAERVTAPRVDGVVSGRERTVMKEFPSTADVDTLSNAADPDLPGKATEPAAGFPGLGPLTRVETDYGPYPAQTLRVRDRVRLRSGRFCPITRVDRFLLDEAFLARNHDAQPVLIAAGRLGYGFPAEPVLLAPGQKLSDRQRLPATLRTAQDLARAGLAHRRPEQFLTYVTFSFPEPEDVCSGGLWLRVEPIQSCPEFE